METPVRERVAIAAGAGGLLAEPGLSAFRRLFATEESAARYNDWASGPIGSAVVRALRDMALHGPAAVSASDASLQYGITLGLGMAANFIADPSTVCPDVFAGPLPSATIPVPDYSVSTDTALDQMGE